MRLVYAQGNDLTYSSIRFDISLQNFKKPYDIFWPQLSTKKKCSEYDFGCKQKGLSNFLALSLSWKIANTGKPA